MIFDIVSTALISSKKIGAVIEYIARLAELTASLIGELGEAGSGFLFIFIL